jgi:hypothetical protein
MTAIQPTDINRYITTIRINFENAYKTQTDEERQILIKSWYAILREYPKEIVDKAVLQAIKHAEYAPRIGTIVKEIERMREAYEKSDAELWAELRGVLREVEKCAYSFRFNAVDPNGKTQGDNARDRVEEIFNGLSLELKEYCRNSRGLIDIAQLSENDLQYEKARFLRVMPTLKERARVRQETPVQLAGIIQGLSGAIDCDVKQIE